MQYFVIEGPDCAGKTTQRDLLGKYLEKNGFKVLLEHEPGKDRENGKKVYEYLHGKLNASMLEVAELYFNDRMELLEKIIDSNHDFVIADRNYLSSFVYQVLKGVPEERIAGINSPFVNNEFVKASAYAIIQLDWSEQKRRLESRA